MAEEHIIVPYQMFDNEQNILIYKDGVCVKTDYVATTNLVEALSALCSENPSIARIDIVGNPIYLEKIKKAMFTKFSNETVEVNIIER